MATVIDALVVELSLDPTQFTKGQRQALDAFKKTQEEAVKGGKDIEEQAKKSGEALGGIKTQALELFAAFAGGKSAVEFFSSIVKGDAAVGRLSRSTNLSADAISRWQGVARIFGGTAEGMAQSFTQVSDAVSGWKVGSISPLIALFRELSTAGGHVIDVNKGVDQTFLDMADNLKAIHDRDPATAGFMSRRLGLDPGLADLMFQGSAAVQKMLDRVNKLGPATKEATDAAGELERRWNSMGVKADAIGRKILNGDGSGGSLGNFITELSDVLNMTPGQAWEYLNRPDRRSNSQSPAAATRAPGAFTSQSDKEAFIRAEATKRGINPEVAMAVARSEGFNNPIGDNGTSFGAFQLHLTPGGRGNAVGDRFTRDTGLDVRDPANEARAIQYALDDVRAHGWSAYHGAANGAHIGAWAGIDRGAGGSTSTNSVVINGPINITPPAGADAADFANRFTAVLKRQSFSAQANDGQN
jgi:hypothetical protein